MAAGLNHRQLGTFELYHVKPPLVRMVASEALGARSEFELGRNFITGNGERTFWFFTWARWACIPFSLLGGYV